MNCLFTININDFIISASRESYISACKRWECDYLEITSGKLSDRFPIAQKYYGYLRLCQYDKLCYLDGDCIISDTCPNPFNIYDGSSNNIYMVRDVPTPSWYDGVYRGPIESVSSRLEAFLDFKSTQLNLGIDDFYNNGFFVAPSKSAIFTKMVSAFESGFIRRHQEEQAIFNVLLHTKQWLMPICLPQIWNWLAIPLGINKQAHIIHYAGCSIGDKQKLINDYVRGN